MSEFSIKTPKGYTAKTKGGKIKIVWNAGFGPKATNAFSTTQKVFDAECLKLCDKYTPKDTGMLIASAQLSSKIGAGELEWTTPYAKARYFAKRKTGSQTGALRGPHWGERMKADNLSHLKNVAKSGVKKGMK